VVFFMGLFFHMTNQALSRFRWFLLIASIALFIVMPYLALQVGWDAEVRNIKGQMQSPGVTYEMARDQTDPWGEWAFLAFLAFFGLSLIMDFISFRRYRTP